MPLYLIFIPPLKLTARTVVLYRGTMIYNSSDFRIVGDFASVENGNEITAFRVSSIESFKTVWITNESVWDIIVRMRSGHSLRLTFREVGGVIDQLLGATAPN